jgi:hypothetical protein
MLSGAAMYGIGQTIRHRLAVLVGSAVAFAIFTSNQLKAQQPNRVVLAEAKNHLQT